MYKIQIMMMMNRKWQDCQRLATFANGKWATPEFDSVVAAQAAIDADLDIVEWQAMNIVRIVPVSTPEGADNAVIATAERPHVVKLSCGDSAEVPCPGYNVGESLRCPECKTYQRIIVVEDNAPLPRASHLGAFTEALRKVASKASQRST